MNGSQLGMRQFGCLARATPRVTGIAVGLSEGSATRVRSRLERAGATAIVTQGF